MCLRLAVSDWSSKERLAGLDVKYNNFKDLNRRSYLIFGLHCLCLCLASGHGG